MEILHIDSSILGDFSVSRQLSAAIVAQLRAGRDDVEVTYRDVAADPLPHMSGEYFAATMAPEKEYSPSLKAELSAGSGDSALCRAGGNCRTHPPHDF